ncbi:MAG: MOSC domain-containing protein [Deltaproteobacteria bacterium]|nr:MOSC domain-containing protein [Deltaproteobacteria bacterium]
METNRGMVAAVSVSSRKGEKKSPVSSVVLVEEHGVRDDAHAGPGHRQVSLLASESIGKMRAKGLSVGPGDFAENITVEGFDLLQAKVGDRIRVGEALLEISQIGKECHTRCAIYFQAGDCVMPREGVFARVIRGGKVAPGDEVRKEEEP